MKDQLDVERGPDPVRMIIETTIFYFHDGVLSKLEGTTLVEGAAHLCVTTRNGIPFRAELFDCQGKYLG